MKLIEAVEAYSNAFRDSPPISGLPPRLNDKAAEVIMAAVSAGKPMKDAEFYAAVGVKPPPADALT